MLKYLVVLLVLLVPQTTFAASSSVTVNNKVNTNNSTSGTNDANVNTNIRIETNGEVTTYSSDKLENIDIKVINGESVIKVDGEIVEQDNEPIESSESAKNKEDNLDEQNANEDRTILEFFGDLFNSIFSLLV